MSAARRTLLGAHGEGKGPPIPCDLKTYPVRVIDGEIQVRVANAF